jgi:predicted phosphodiesterase
MGKYRLLVIDDQIGTRQVGYEHILGGTSQFDLTFCMSSNDLVKNINETPAHGYVVDVRLWPESNFFQTAMELIVKKGRPVILVSSKWSEHATLDQLSQLSPDQKHNIRHFMAWDEHWQSDTGKASELMSNSTRSNINLALDQFYTRSANTPQLDQTISLLHIADLQFGDPSTAPNSFLDECETADAIRHHGVSFVVITGDISFSGHPDEYKMAADWIQRLTERLWPGKDMSEHVLVVPGNHDVDLRISAAGQYDFKFPSKDESKWQLISRPVGSANYSGFMHFREFLCSLNHDETWLQSRMGFFRCNDRFLGYGLRFVHLNSAAAISVDSPSRCYLADDALKRLADDIERRNQLELADGIFTVVLSHHGFSGAEYVGFEKQEEVTRFLDRIKADILLFGHGHGMVAQQRQQNPLCGMIEIMAPTQRLKQKERIEDEMRGFNVVEFTRANGMVSAIRLIPYEIKGCKVKRRDVDGVTNWTPRKQFCQTL